MTEPQPQPAFHFVCTHAEAIQLVDSRDNFWVCDCGCRKNTGNCQKSRIDVCLMFRGDMEGNWSNYHRITDIEVTAILAEADFNNLVSRPFRNDKDRSIVDGICFCCDCCCEYFTKPGEICDKGKLIERTDMDLCTHCGDCVDVCYFQARDLDGGKLTLDRENCYGCGLCVGSCPEDCIEITTRI